MLLTCYAAGRLAAFGTRVSSLAAVAVALPASISAGVLLPAPVAPILHFVQLATCLERARHTPTPTPSRGIRSQRIAKFRT